MAAKAPDYQNGDIGSWDKVRNVLNGTHTADHREESQWDFLLICFRWKKRGWQYFLSQKSLHNSSVEMKL